MKEDQFMKQLYTSTIEIGKGATEKAHSFINERFKKALVVCDVNTVKYADKYFPDYGSFVYPDHIHATDILADELIPYLEGVNVLIACGSGTVHDLTRFAAHKAGLPCISYPTAASVDGFVSNIAAMTINGQKITYPSTAPIALFAEPEVFCDAPRSLTVSGVGDIIGKYISLFEWNLGRLLIDETFDPEIEKLETEAIDRVLKLDPNDKEYTESVMKALVISGEVIQLFGNSRPASGSEHHLSHLWEMNCINEQTEALHGEKVGVATLLVLEKYKSLTDDDIVYRPKSFDPGYLMPVYGRLTDGIIDANKPSILDKLTPERVIECKNEIRNMINALPDAEFVRNYFLNIGAKTKMNEIDLPDTKEFVNKSLVFSPYVRNRLTLLKIL